MIINSCEVEAIYGDIFDLEVECIVNPANNSLLGGGGLDGLIHQNDGEDLLDDTVKLAGTYTSGAKITRAHKLKNAYIIHVVGPISRRIQQTSHRIVGRFPLRTNYNCKG